MTRSLQSRLLLGIAGGSALALLFAALLTYWLMERGLLTELDASLLAEANTLGALVEAEPGRIRTELAEREMPPFDRSQRPEYYEVRRQNGDVIERSPRLNGANLGEHATRANEPTWASLTLPDGRPGRCISLAVIPQIERPPDAESGASPASVSPPTFSVEPVTLVVARDTQDLQNVLTRFRIALAIAIGSAALVATLISAPIVRLGLAPLRSLGRQIEAIDGQTVSPQLNVDQAPREVQSVITCLNRLLDRLITTIARERAFSANVAHELRTPLAGLRTTLEVALSRHREPAEYRGALHACLEVQQQTQGLVESLLALARVDAGQFQLRREPIDLGELLKAAWAPFVERAELRRMSIQWHLMGCATVESDPDALKSIIDNLYDNALTYANAGGTIEIALEEYPDKLNLRISNSGCQLSREVATQVFERFWRGDANRSETGLHAGLGLALCHDLAQVLGASIAVDAEVGGVFRVVLSFPFSGSHAQRPINEKVSAVASLGSVSI